MRDRILARRARFIGSAVTLLGCSPSARPSNVAVVEPIDAAVPTATATVPEPVRDAGTPDVARKAGRAITIPEGISDETRARYERLDASVSSFRDNASQIEADMKTAPKCPGSACDEFWRKMAGRLEELQQQASWFGFYCPNKREETDRFLEEVDRQKNMAGITVAKLRERAAGAVGQGRFDRYQAEWDAAHPRPCLSVICDRW
jgi:hypothetical protein